MKAGPKGEPWLSDTCEHRSSDETGNYPVEADAAPAEDLEAQRRTEHCHVRTVHVGTVPPTPSVGRTVDSMVMTHDLINGTGQGSNLISDPSLRSSGKKGDSVRRSLRGDGVFAESGLPASRDPKRRIFVRHARDAKPGSAPPLPWFGADDPRAASLESPSLRYQGIARDLSLETVRLFLSKLGRRRWCWRHPGCLDRGKVERAPSFLRGWLPFFS